MPGTVDMDRRRFVGGAASIAAAQLVSAASAAAPSSDGKPIEPRTVGTNGRASFASLKQIDAGLLNVGYAEAGPADGPPVILLHGWPYDIHSFVDVERLLAAAGFRVIIPYLRGYGTTLFLSSETVRNGQPSGVAVDIIACWMRSRSRKPPWRALTGARVLPTLSQPSGQNDAGRWSR
jgi:hypothetical protein